MKNFPISKSEQHKIIELVADWKQWEGTRYGFHVHIVRVPVAAGHRQIVWGVSDHGHTQGGMASTVTEAIEEVNTVIDGGHKAFLQRNGAKTASEAVKQLDLFDIGASKGVYHD